MKRSNPFLNASPAEIAAALKRSLWSFGDRSLRDIGAEVWEGILDDDLTGRSAQLAYYFFLSLFPGLMFVSALLGMTVGAQSQLRNHILTSFATLLPPAAFLLVQKTLTEIVSSSSASKAIVALLFAFWSATSGMSAVQDTLNGVCRVKDSRPYWRSTLVAMVLTVVVLTLAIIAVVCFFYGGELVGYLASRIGLNEGMTMLWKMVQWPIAIFLISLSFSVTYHFAPDLKQHQWKWITPGSVIGTLGWLAVSGLFRAYLHFFNHYSLTYGSLGAVTILLLWFYLSGFMLLLGAEVNSSIRFGFIKKERGTPVFQMERRNTKKTAPAAQAPPTTNVADR